MKKRCIFSLKTCLMVGFALCLSSSFVNAQDRYSGIEIGTPAYSYYLAENILRSYEQMFQIQDNFQKKAISNNLRPRNVYERTLGVMEEFDTLFPGVITQQQRDAAYAVDADKAGPKEISGILMLMLHELERQNALVEYSGPRSAKTPNDVYQIMRKIGWYHRKIASQRELKTNWDSVDRVYETVVYKFLPTVYAIADERELSYESYAFPMQPSQQVKPRNIYKLVVALYQQIVQYDALHEGEALEAVQFVAITDCDEISPADVFDLGQIVAAELRLTHPHLQISGQLDSRFSSWRAAQDKLLPGHTFRLLQHLYITIERSVQETTRS